MALPFGGLTAWCGRDWAPMALTEVRPWRFMHILDVGVGSSCCLVAVCYHHGHRTSAVLTKGLPYGRAGTGPSPWE